MPAYLNIALVVAIVAVLWTLFVILCREWVKRDLRERGYTPVKIRWRPLASSRARCAFHVIYVDETGLIYRAHCRTSWIRPSISWRRVP